MVVCKENEKMASCCSVCGDEVVVGFIELEYHFGDIEKICEYRCKEHLKQKE